MMRKAFSMITAIFVIIIMATVAILVFNLSGRATKQTLVQYRTEQAALLARSYTELAVMAVMNHDRTTVPDCVEDIDGEVNALEPGKAPVAGSGYNTGDGYKVETRIYYIGNNLPCSQSRKLIDSTDPARSATKIAHDNNYRIPGSADALAAVIIDVYVSYKDPFADDPNLATKITYHRRTLQKI
jgi:hypothetical protein